MVATVASVDSKSRSAEDPPRRPASATLTPAPASADGGRSPGLAPSRVVAADLGAFQLRLPKEGSACGCGGGGPCACSRKAADRRPARPSQVPPNGVSPAVASVVAQPGAPLPAPLRARFEQAFGEDLSDVRLHSDALAAGASEALDARAFTSGQHVAFESGAWAPGTPAGDRLLAHEITHVLQHRRGAVAPAGGAAEQAAEAEADRAAAEVVGGGRPAAPASPPPPVARQPHGGGSGVTRVDINCADMTMHLDGRQAHTWRLNECDFTPGDYDAVIQQNVRTTTFRLDLQNAPDGTHSGFAYAIMANDPDPLDAVQVGQHVRVHVSNRPSPARPAAPAPRPAPGVTRADLDCTAMTIRLDGPRAHTWRLSSCDFTPGDYEATVAQNVRTTTFRLDLRNAPDAHSSFEYAMFANDPNPLDAVQIGQSVHVHASGPAPATAQSGGGAAAAGGGQAGSNLNFHVAAVDGATYELISGQHVTDLGAFQLGPGFRVRDPAAAGGGGSGGPGGLRVLPGAGFGILGARPYTPTPRDPWAGTFGDQWAGGGGAAYEAAARARAATTGGFVPSWALDPASQTAWQGMRLGQLEPMEMQLVQDVLNAPDVLLGRSINVRGQGGFVLDDWLVARGIPWSQRWQDVYNRALYARTSTGIPIRAMSGGGYTLGESTAAESGASRSGIGNEPFWPENTVPLGNVLEQLPEQTGLQARLAALPPGTVVRGVVKAGGTILLIYSVYESATRIAEASPEDRPVVVGQEVGSFAGGWVGAALSSALAGAVVCSETGPGALVCSLAFGIVGGATGSTVGAGLGGAAVSNLQQIGQLLRDPQQLMDAGAMLLPADQRQQYFESQEILRQAGF